MGEWMYRSTFSWPLKYWVLRIFLELEGGRYRHLWADCLENVGTSMSSNLMCFPYLYERRREWCKAHVCAVLNSTRDRVQLFMGSEILIIHAASTTVQHVYITLHKHNTLQLRPYTNVNYNIMRGWKQAQCHDESVSWKGELVHL
jgi:hypothetical protein